MMRPKRLTSSISICCLSIFILALVICIPHSKVWAQEKSYEDPNGESIGELAPGKSGVKKKSDEAETPKVKVERGAGGKKVYVIKTGFVIEGRIQKPNAFYVLQRSQINYDWSALKKRFVPKIISSLKKSPF